MNVQSEKMAIKSGLTNEEAKKRLISSGPNLISLPHEIRFLEIAREEITEPMILLLLAVGVFYTIWGSVEDAITIFSIIFILVLVEVWNEYRAKKAISALSIMSAPKTKVFRSGEIKELNTADIVYGDLLVLIPGTRVAADGVVNTAVSLQIDESSLTGESFPQEKMTGDEVFAGTLVLSGEGSALVKETGNRTRIGKISALAQEIKPPRTPLQIAMKSLAKKLVWIAILFSLLIPFIGILQGFDIRTMFLLALALAFATIPEELPIIITMNLGLGSYQLSREHFLVKKLKAAETLGNATVIVTDKTGTITESTMRVAAIFPSDRREEVLLAARAAMTQFSLSITDRAIIEELSKVNPPEPGSLARERTFGNGKKTQALLRKSSSGFVLYLIGAPEEVIARVRGDTDESRKVLAAETSKGRRVVAVAHREVSEQEGKLPFEDLEKSLELDGLLSLEDPPRQGVKETIEQARQAGVRTIMVTGDHPATAEYIGNAVGIPAAKVITGQELDGVDDVQLRDLVTETSIFARAGPEDKYRIVKALQENHEVVAVTGDGVNDSLALKGADIGIAMGIKGTDAAKEAADIVLADDNFVTVGRGIFEGRKIYDNLRKGVRYYLSVKFALITIFVAALAIGVSFPFAPIQIILLELFMDLGASAAFVAEPGEASRFVRPPEKGGEAFMDRSMWTSIAIAAAILFAAVFIPYMFGLQVAGPSESASAYAFTAWMVGTIALAFVSRSTNETLMKLGPLGNRVMLAWAALAMGFLVLAVFWQPLGAHFRLGVISLSGFLAAAGISIICILLLELRKVIPSRSLQHEPVH
ncbi:MAG: cation-transporting P-type ATPase [Methanoregulaceae archaeon]|nr:cation-transporting P-type ATPase [Methanoregulaceae archaeon]